MKDYQIKFKANEKEYSAIFNLNVMQEIQEEYGTVEKWAELTDAKAGEINAKALIFGMRAMINEAIEINNDEKGENQPSLTLKQVGRLISQMGLENGAQTLNNAVIEATKEDNSKNA